MKSGLNIVNRTGLVSEEFKPYYEKENDFRRLSILHSIAAFIISPIFCYFVYNTDVAPVYFYIGLSYTFLFPLYILLCYLIKPLYDKLIYFFIAHLFVITAFAFTDLTDKQFALFDFFCFYALYAVILYVMQRLYPAILYNFFVLSLLIYGYQYVDNPEISKSASFGLFFVLALCSVLVLYSRQRMINSVEDYSNYLRKIVNNPGNGYVLFRFINDQIILVDFNHESLRLLDVDENGIQKMVFDLVDNDSLEQIKSLKIGHEFHRVYPISSRKDKRALEFSFSVLLLKNGFYWLLRINDATRELKEKQLLEAREQKYRNLYYRNQAGVFTVNEHAVIIDCNDAFIDMFEGEIQQNNVLFDKNQFNEWEEIKEMIVSNDNLRNYQTHFKLKNGKTKWFIFNWYLDKITGLIEGTIIDLTEVQKASFALRQSEEKYRQIYEESNDAILLMDGDIIIDTNRKSIQLFGIPKTQLIGKRLWELSFNNTEDEYDEYNRNIQRLLRSKHTKFNWDFRSGQHKVESEVVIVELTIGDNTYNQCVIHDLSELKATMRVLEKSRESFKSVLENTPEGILIVSEKEILYTNPEIHKILNKEELYLNTLFPEMEQQRFEELYELHKESKAILQNQFLVKDGSNSEIPIDVTIVATTFEEKDATMIIFKDVSLQNQLAREMLRAEMAEETNKKMAKEIKERIRAEKLLQEQFLRSNAIFDSSSNTLLLTLDTQLKISSFNSHCQQYFHYLTGKEMSIGVSFPEFFGSILRPIDIKLFTRLLNRVRNGESQQHEVSFSVDGNTIWMEIFFNPIYDSEGQVTELSLVAHDITEKKNTEKEIVESLKEKEVLLKEIHHRVKNNLQVISSILNLQSSFVKDSRTLEILEESRNRIRSMAIIHENLYQTTNFSSINFSDYLTNLTGNLISSYRIHSGHIELRTDMDKVELILDQAIPCGLLVNELITNALKYAFPGDTSGEIFVGLKEKDGRILLEISDNGVGLPKDFNILNSDTLGLQLVTTLVEQLDGEIKFDSSKGIKYLITFDKAKL
jgi:PAS domain S-box-containing protein